MHPEILKSDVRCRLHLRPKVHIGPRHYGSGPPISSFEEYYISPSMAQLVWRAGFELEVILGDLGDPRFKQDLGRLDAMDEASPYLLSCCCKKIAGIHGTCLDRPPQYSFKTRLLRGPEYGLDPLQWPGDRLAGVELLTPQLPLDEADAICAEITDADYEIDGDFNFIPSDTTAECGWHINIDAGDKQRLDPAAYIVETHELLLLSRNSRLFGPYTGLQRHAVGIAVLRHLQCDPQGNLLRSTGLENLLNMGASRSKRYAANFAKHERGYVELRHFSALSFFNGPSLVEQLDRIPTAMAMGPNQGSHLTDIFLRKFLVLFEWLESIRDRITWEMGPYHVISQGKVLFDGELIGTLVASRLVALYLHGPRKYKYTASIQGILLLDVVDAMVLLALDLSELRNVGVRRAPNPNKGFRQAVSRLATRLKSDSTFSGEYQLSVVRGADEETWNQRA